MRQVNYATTRDNVLAEMSCLHPNTDYVLPSCPTDHLYIRVEPPHRLPRADREERERDTLLKLHQYSTKRSAEFRRCAGDPARPDTLNQEMAEEKRLLRDAMAVLTHELIARLPAATDDESTELSDE